MIQNKINGLDPETNQPVDMLTTDWIAGSMCYDLALLKINSEKEFLKLALVW
jgi:hypothetical protein